ncbi:ATP-binding protein [Streptomyces parvulus]|uniref:ATP-binding protein n=1 Tax=Streptomyces parvulus TaxID=146923 RepID=UPI0038226C2F
MPETDPVVPATPWEYTLYIPNDLRAVTVCRRTLRLILTMHGLIRLADAAELLATELVSNAVRHTTGPAALRVRWVAGVLRIGAWDADPGPPEPPTEDPALLTRTFQNVLRVPFPEPRDFAVLNTDVTEIEPVERRVDTLL